MKKITFYIVTIGLVLFLNTSILTTRVKAANLATETTSLILAVEKDYPPFLFVENNEVRGISYDYAKLIAQKLGLSLQVTEPMQLQDMLTAVKTGKANLLADITKTAERDTFLEFSDSFIQTPAVVLARKDTGIKWGYQANVGLKIAVGKGYGVVSYLKEKFPQAIFVELSSDTDVIRAVALGATDVGVLDTSSLSYLLQKEPLSNVEIIANTDFLYSLSFAVSEENKTLIPLLNQAIREITPAEKNYIFNKWQSTFPKKDTSIFLIESVTIAITLIILSVFIILSLIRRVKNKTKELLEINKNLDVLVEQKTRDLSLSKNEAVNNKKAILNILEDVQSEKEKVEEVTQKLKIATESAEIGILELNLSDQKISIDATTSRIYGLENTDQVLDFKKWQSLVHPDDISRVKEKVNRSITENLPFEDIFRIILPNGDARYVKGFAKVQFDKNKQPLKLVGVNLDVTKEREVDRAKTEFVSLASHQLRTPLTSIKLFIELLLGDKKNIFSDTQKEYLQNIQLATKRMVQLVNDLLNVSRLESGRLTIAPEPSDMVKIIKNVLIEVTGIASERGVKIIFNEPEQTIPQISLDPSLVHEVLISLISNAIRYSKNNAGVVQLNLTEKNNEYQVSVQDNGIGIPIEAQPKIFAKFFRADNAVSQEADGSGLGLYIAKMIMDTSGGRIWFESIIGKGTTFFFAIPKTGMKENKGERKITITQ